MSFFSEASLAMIPSGYKTSKVYSAIPTSGDGDLTFTRSNDTATRVGPDGLIQRVRTNVLLQSNSFDTTWTNANSTDTSGQAGYDGTNNAWRLNDDAVDGSHDVRQVVSLSGSLTISVYAKAGTISWLKLFNGVSIAYFNLSTGVAGTGGGIITSVGNGWYRCSISSNGSSSLALVGMTNADNTTSYAGDGNGTIFIQNAQLEVGDIATDYIATTSAAVSVGPVANVPRLDYLGSSCGKLLLEPQRTNSLTYSESFDNAAWTKNGATITANDAVSPDGFTNADKLVEDTSTGEHLLQRNISVSAGSYTWGVFAKAAERKYVVLRNNASGGSYRNTCFDLELGTIVFDGLGNAQIQSFGNGWFRITANSNETSVVARNYEIHLSDAAVLTNSAISYTGNGTSGAFIYGAQLEAGAYATSYINTQNSAVTRGADAANNLAASSLIGTTEGVIFIDIQTPSTIGANSTFSIGAGTSGEYAQIEIRTDLSINWRYRVGGTDYINENVGSFTAGSRLKIAFAYKNLDSILYLNGSSIATDTGTIATNAWDEVRFTNFAGTSNLEARVNQTLLFPTRLSNSDLAALTA